MLHFYNTLLRPLPPPSGGPSGGGADAKPVVSFVASWRYNRAWHGMTERGFRAVRGLA